MEVGTELKFIKQVYIKEYGKVFPKNVFTVYEVTHNKIRCIDEEDVDITLPLCILKEVAKEI